MSSVRGALIAGALVGACLACAGGPPDDATVRAQLERHRSALDEMCAAFPALGIELLGRQPGIATLAARGERLFEVPTEAQLAAAGLDRPTWEAWTARLGEVEAVQIEHTQYFGVSERTVALTVDLRGLSVSGSATELHCGLAPPWPVVARSDEHGGASEGSQCAELAAPTAQRPGWWVCRTWN